MKLKGRVWKEGKFWLISVPALAAETQGATRREAYEMLVDWFRTALDDEAFAVDVAPEGKDGVVVSFPEPARILALMVSRRRGMAGLTLQQLADRVGAAGKSVIAQAEKGTSELGFSRLATLLDALGCDLVVDVVPRADAGPAAEVPAERRKRA